MLDAIILNAILLSGCGGRCHLRMDCVAKIARRVGVVHWYVLRTREFDREAAGRYLQVMSLDDPTDAHGDRSRSRLGPSATHPPVCGQRCCPHAQILQSGVDALIVIVFSR